jgi:predicted MPP superfamily phosphohydrolase
VLDYSLFALAWLGHACLLMVILNFVYAYPLDRLFLKAFRAAVGLCIFVGPAIFASLASYRITGILRSAAEEREFVVPAIYIVVALLVSCIGLPYVTVRRLLRRRPAFVLDEVTTTVDVAKELGHFPYGDGKSASVARQRFNNIFNVDFTTLTLELPNLPPAWDGLTLLQLSDLHFIGTPAKEYFDFVIRRCMLEGTPDLTLITGDIVDTDTHHEWIAPILGQLRWNVGAFAILGNHDWWQDQWKVRECLRHVGFRVLGNSWEQIDVRGEKLTLIGHEGPWFQPGPDLSSCPAGAFRLLLSHTPDNIRWARRRNVSLMLSGHNHGGQIRLPVFGSIFVPSKYSRRFDMGTFYEPPTLLHVNRGLSGKEPLRFRCNPQVTRIVLRKSTGTHLAR